MHSRFDAVVVGSDPHCGILVHLSVSGVEQIVIITYLSEALCSLIIGEVICAAVNVNKSVAYNESVFSAPEFTCFETAVLTWSSRVYVATLIYIYLASGSRVNDAAVCTNGSVKYLALFTVVKFILICEESVAKPFHETCFFVEVVPCNILYVSCYCKCIAVSNIPIRIEPVCAFFKFNESSEQRLTGPEVLSPLAISAERSSYQLTVIIECVSESVNFTHSGMHLIILLVKEVEV